MNCGCAEAVVVLRGRRGLDYGTGVDCAEMEVGIACDSAAPESVGGEKPDNAAAAAVLLQSVGMFGLVASVESADLDDFAQDHEADGLPKRHSPCMCYLCEPAMMEEDGIAFLVEAQSDPVGARTLLLVVAGIRPHSSPRSALMQQNDIDCLWRPFAYLLRCSETRFAAISLAGLANELANDFAEKPDAGFEASFHDCSVEESSTDFAKAVTQDGSGHGGRTRYHFVEEMDTVSARTHGTGFSAEYEIELLRGQKGFSVQRLHLAPSTHHCFGCVK